ncbi:trans-aconitate methyltransferase 1 [Scheffersomyces xylosifermentans]|uniref:trans-aconitate methyltransferase 1 n=1 Tax=Scheffersomyces xylosifermentans TaxID=1304137 RepID=UPI00315C65CA
MASYSESTFDSQHYDDSRPNYPESFYRELVKYHDGQEKKEDSSRRDNAVDVGCGSGFVTFKLLDYFKHVQGTDPSSTMIKQCKESKQFAAVNEQSGTSDSKKRLDFLIGTGENFPESIENDSVDLVTAAEAAHWFDHPAFFKEVHRVLKPSGTLSYWFYKDPVFIGYPRANEIYTNYTYNSSLELNPKDEFERYMGPYYQQPGHDYLRTLLKEIEVPTDLFYDMERHEYISSRDGVPQDYSKPGPPATALFIHKRITLKWFLNYVKSWSAYHSWMKDHGNKYNIAEKFVDELKQELGWTDDTELDVVWDTVYTFARKR